MSYVPTGCIHGSITSDCIMCNPVAAFAALNNRINGLHEHKLRQINENRKVSQRLNGIDVRVEYCSSEFNNMFRSIPCMMKRIEKLEALIKILNEENINNIWKKINSLDQIIETNLNTIFQKFNPLENSDHDERIHDIENIGIEKRLINLENKLDGKRPHKCPVCDGKVKCFQCGGTGAYFTGNYPGQTATCEFCKGSPSCKQCEGKGIIRG